MEQGVANDPAPPEEQGRVVEDEDGRWILRLLVEFLAAGKYI